jgi:hypothetical protein
MCRPVENRIDLFARRESNGQRQSHTAHFAARDFHRATQRHAASFI